MDSIKIFGNGKLEAYVDALTNEVDVIIEEYGEDIVTSISGEQMDELCEAWLAYRKGIDNVKSI